MIITEKFHHGQTGRLHTVRILYFRNHLELQVKDAKERGASSNSTIPIKFILS